MINEDFFIIAEGYVKVYATNNPFRRKEYNKQNILRNTMLDQIYDSASGNGHLCKTFNRANLGVVTSGQWLGEENVVLRGEIP